MDKEEDKYRDLGGAIDPKKLGKRVNYGICWLFSQFSLLSVHP